MTISVALGSDAVVQAKAAEKSRESMRPLLQRSKPQKGVECLANELAVDDAEIDRRKVPRQRGQPARRSRAGSLATVLADQLDGQVVILRLLEILGGEID